MLLKRNGRGHDPGGVEATKLGDLAIDCPACPLPGKNMPEELADCSKPSVKL